MLLLVFLMHFDETSNADQLKRTSKYLILIRLIMAMINDDNQILSTLAGTLAFPAAFKYYPNLAGQRLVYNQEEFGANRWFTSMGSSGFIYVPSGCQDWSKNCKLHITFHWCKQSKYDEYRLVLTNILIITEFYLRVATY